jgi:uncharacterized membrane protein
MTWFSLSLISLLVYGVKDFLLKVACEEKDAKFMVVFVYCLVVLALGLPFAVLSGIDFDFPRAIILFAFLTGCLSLLVNYLRLSALAYSPGSAAYPIFSLSTVIIVIASLLFLGEKVSPLQMIGIIVGIFAVQFFAHMAKGEKRKYRNEATGIFLAVLSILPASITPFLIKDAAQSHINPFVFISLCYFFSTLFLLPGVVKARHLPRKTLKSSVGLGALIGILNFIGFYTFMMALGSGPMAIVAVLSSLSVACLVLLSVFIYKDKLTQQRFIGLALSVFAVLVLRL